MRKYQVLFYLVVLISIFGCKSIKNDCTRTYINFKLLKKEKHNTGAIKFDGVYLWNFDIPNGEPTNRYTFIRFFENGRVYLSCGYDSIPNNEVFDSLNHGKYGHYTVDNNVVTIETYGGYVGYYFTYFLINKDYDLVSLGTKARRKSKNTPMVKNVYKSIYKFNKINSLKNVTFW